MRWLSLTPLTPPMHSTPFMSSTARLHTPWRVAGDTPHFYRYCRHVLLPCTAALRYREYAALADDLVALGMLPTGADKAAVVPALTGVM